MQCFNLTGISRIVTFPALLGLLARHAKLSTRFHRSVIFKDDRQMNDPTEEKNSGE